MPFWHKCFAGGVDCSGSHLELTFSQSPYQRSRGVLHGPF